MKNIRPLALALIKNQNNEYFFHQAFDSLKNETFYRPLGGGIEFGELGADALEREFLEEINSKIKVGSLLKVFENIFTYEGKEGHEVILLFESNFLKGENYNQEFDIIENGKVLGKAVWKSLAQIKEEDSKLYPLGIDVLM